MDLRCIIDLFDDIKKQIVVILDVFEQFNWKLFVYEVIRYKILLYKDLC